jgi:hypothetical protein
MRSRRILVVLAAAAVATIFLTTRARPRESQLPPPDPRDDAQAIASPPAPSAPGAAAQAAAASSTPDVDVQPLFDRKTRLEPGKAVKLRFAARAKSSGSPVSSADLSVSVRHRGEPERRLAAFEVEEGVYEATFLPHGPGEYRVALLAGAVPISSVPPVKLGLVGAVGADDPTPTDITASTNYDPHTTRSRGTGRGRRR